MFITEFWMIGNEKHVLWENRSTLSAHLFLVLYLSEICIIYKTHNKTAIYNDLVFGDIGHS